ncbi:MAG: hypothetical protein K8T26_08680 [Lentisphaerae bacterium]|nr:hypothetical protein [Lentisphaerota bacterium]
MNDLLFGWWAFWLAALVVGGTAARVAALMQVEINGFIPVISTMGVCITSGMSGAIAATRWWDRLMRRKTIKANYIALVVMAVLLLAFGPGPMMFIE